MKKFYITLILGAFMTLAGVNANAETRYCELTGVQKFMSAKNTIDVDFGNSPWPEKMKGEDGKKITFNSVVDGLNYMAADGWEVVTAYHYSQGQQLVLHFLLKKEE